MFTNNNGNPDKYYVRSTLVKVYLVNKQFAIIKVQINNLQQTKKYALHLVLIGLLLIYHGWQTD